MASIGWEGKRARIVFRDEEGKQQTIRLGECPKDYARSAKMAIGHLVIAKRHNGVPHPDAVRWLGGLDDVLYARVAAHGLCQPRAEAEVVTLGTLLERFESMAVVKDSTKAAYKQATDCLRAHLGEATPLDSITPVHADTWRKSISEPMKVKRAGKEVTKRLAPATVAKRVHVAKLIFGRAVKWKMIPSNPFADLRAGSQANPARSHYVTRETIKAVLDACPDDQWRAVIALARFGGLRCPSEMVDLRWGDIAWDTGAMTVRSPKTAHHEGHAVRVVPIAPELRSILQDLFDVAEIGVEAVVPRVHDAKQNLRTTFLKILARAGVKPWPRPMQNLRASCETDWVEQFPAHEVAGWLGHSPMIAAKHYLQKRDVHFAMATGKGQAAANPATHTRPSRVTASKGKEQNPENPAEMVGCGVECDTVGNEAMGATGLEPVTSAM
jgi:integrase